jgi:hypothetical protein
MSILETTLLTRTKKRTRRDELAILGDNSNADFTYYTKLAVRRLSQDSLSLRGDASGSVTSSSQTITIPSDMIDGTAAIDGLKLGSESDSRNNGNLDPMTWEDYLDGSTRGYVLRNKVIYIRPFPDTDMTYNLSYRKFHGSSVTTLEFDDKYEECLIPLLCHYVYADLGRQFKTAADAEEIEYKRKLSEVVDRDQPPVVVSRRRS